MFFIFLSQVLSATVTELINGLNNDTECLQDIIAEYIQKTGTSRSDVQSNRDQLQSTLLSSDSFSRDISENTRNSIINSSILTSENEYDITSEYIDYSNIDPVSQGSSKPVVSFHSIEDAFDCDGNRFKRVNIQFYHQGNDRSELRDINEASTSYSSLRGNDKEKRNNTESIEYTELIFKDFSDTICDKDFMDFIDEEAEKDEPPTYESLYGEISE